MKFLCVKCDADKLSEEEKRIMLLMDKMELTKSEKHELDKFFNSVGKNSLSRCCEKCYKLERK